jgi:integrase
MPKANRPRRYEGITARHSRGCASRTGGSCNCDPSWQAAAWSPRDRKRIFKTFPTLAAAKAWRADAQVAIKEGRRKAATPTTVRQAWAAWIAGAEDGSISTRSGDPYKPSALRGYRAAMREGGPVMRALGAAKLSAVRRQDVQDVADRLRADGADPSTVRNALMPLRVLYRRAIRDGIVAVNPCTGVELPAVRGRRDRIASPDEAAALIAALPEGDRALWATALYAGLRAGELMALRWGDVDLASGLIRVERAYDPKGGGQLVDVKSRAGRRRVPMTALLRDHLDEQKLRTGGEPEALCFGREDGRPFSGTAVRDRALRAWKAAGLAPITLHECRHTFASIWIAAGVGAKALSTYMGHANIAITLDRYGHLMPGNEEEAAGLVDAYLARADTAGRLTALDG